MQRGRQRWQRMHAPPAAPEQRGRLGGADGVARRHQRRGVERSRHEIVGQRRHLRAGAVVQGVQGQPCGRVRAAGVGTPQLASYYTHSHTCMEPTHHTHTHSHLAHAQLRQDLLCERGHERLQQRGQQQHNARTRADVRCGSGKRQSGGRGGEQSAGRGCGRAALASPLAPSGASFGSAAQRSPAQCSQQQASLSCLYATQISVSCAGWAHKEACCAAGGQRRTAPPPLRLAGITWGLHEPGRRGGQPLPCTPLHRHRCSHSHACIDAPTATATLPTQPTWKKRLPALLTIMAVFSASFMRSPSSAAGGCEAGRQAGRQVEEEGGSSGWQRGRRRRAPAPVARLRSPGILSASTAAAWQRCRWYRGNTHLRCTALPAPTPWPPGPPPSPCPRWRLTAQARTCRSCGRQGRGAGERRGLSLL